MKQAEKGALVRRLSMAAQGEQLEEVAVPITTVDIVAVLGNRDQSPFHR